MPPRAPRARRPSVLLAAALVLGLASALLPTVTGTDAGRVASARPAGTEIEPWSQVEGTDGRDYIADQQGRALQLRGTNIKTDDPEVGASAQVLDDIAARGFNLVRLSIFWDTFEPTDDAWDEAYFAKVRAALDRAEARGIWVVLDMHQDGFGARFAGKGLPDWVTDDGGLPFEPQPSWLLNYLQPGMQEAWENFYERPEYQAAFVDAWSEVVTRFVDHPALLGYDLLNEPFGKLREGEPFLDAVRRVESEQLTPMFQRLTDAIRSVDPQRWVFIHPPNQASLGLPTFLGPISGGNIAFFPHMYDSAIETATYTPGATPVYDPAFFTTYGNVIGLYPETYDVPMLVGEWGLASPELPGMDRFVADALALLEEQASGWTMFNGCRGGGYCPFDAAGADRPGIGQIVQPWAHAIAGSPTSFHYDAEARTLTVVFTDSDAAGPTELRVPASTYGAGGWVVETSDADGATSTSEPGLLDGFERVLVTTPRTGEAHAICLKPQGAPAGCEVPVDAEPPPVDPDPTGPDPTDPAPPAAPIAAPAAFTG